MYVVRLGGEKNSCIWCIIFYLNFKFLFINSFLSVILPVNRCAKILVHVNFMYRYEA